jgi:hypothetical protein
MKFAVSAIGPFMVTLVHEVEQLPDPVPVQLINNHPVFALAEIGTLAPATCQPEVGENVPPFEGLACMVR